ncbi:MAG: glycosyltransferase family 2 protein [Patescibacteria group bacterium]|jgi:glycosyltransferase involved in cell wall biosynthesis
MTDQKPLLSVILPCRNEEQALPFCLAQIKEVFKNHNLTGEIIVSDSSADKSSEIAKEFGAVLVKHDKVGYGIAYLEGFKLAQGKYLFLADADGTYDFNEIPKFLDCLRQGYDLVIGNRFAGKMEKGAMPWSHRYLGNPVLSAIFRKFFKAKIIDVHCGLRAITKEALVKLNLKTTGMEFASEMMVKAAKRKLKIKELPIDYFARRGKSKLKPLADAWRHLRFMLLYSPFFLFFLPGAILFILGLALLLLLSLKNIEIVGLKLQYHWLLAASLLTITGYQLIIFALFAKTYAITHLGEEDKFINKLHRHINIESGILAGLVFGLIGGLVYLSMFWQWLHSGFGELSNISESIFALTFIIIGIQTIFSAFILSILGIKEE